MNPRESNPDQLSCRFRGHLAIIQATDSARAFGNSRGLTDDDLARLCIVIEELVANLFDHGGLTEQDEIELNLVAEPAGIRVVIVDPGIPFDPWTAPRKVERPDRGGGVGIDLIRAWAQFVGYDETPEGNRLELLVPAHRQS